MIILCERRIIHSYVCKYTTSTPYTADPKAYPFTLTTALLLSHLNKMHDVIKNYYLKPGEGMRRDNYNTHYNMIMLKPIKLYSLYVSHLPIILALNDIYNYSKLKKPLCALLRTKLLRHSVILMR